ncbi:hypothetical protein PTKIN_Ptkin10aG0172600 [Pterospermum kingtungense]
MTSLFSQGFRSFEFGFGEHLFPLFKRKDQRIEKSDDYKEEILVHAPWDTLPTYIWDLIFQRLPLVDRVHASVVCKEWSSILNQTLQPVWMLLLSGSMGTGEKMSFFDLSENRIGELNLPKSLPGATLFGVSKGWFQLTKGRESSLQPFLLDPISGTKISLPPLSTIPPSTSNSKAASATILNQIEISSKNASELVVAATFDRGKILALCKPKHNNKWTIFEGLGDKYHFRSVLFCDGILYAFVDTYLEEDTFQFQTHSVKLDDDNCVVLNLIPIEIFRDIGPSIILEHPIEDVDFFAKNYVANPYMVESNGELLVVVKILDVSTLEDDTSDDDDDETDDTPLLSCFRVERFEVFKVEANDTVLHVTRLNNLNDRTLFIDGEDSLSITTAGENFSKNCIYFLEDGFGHCFHGWKPNMISRESGVFHFDNGRIERWFPSLDLANRPCNWWFFPNIKIGGFH